MTTPTLLAFSLVGEVLLKSMKVATPFHPWTGARVRWGGVCTVSKARVDRYSTGYKWPTKSGRCCRADVPVGGDGMRQGKAEFRSCANLMEDGKWEGKSRYSMSCT